MKSIKIDEFLSLYLTAILTFLCVCFLVALTLAIFFEVSRNNTFDVDKRTEELCREWAKADHSGAVPRERYEWLGGKEYFDSYDWYGSCMLNNTKNKVAGEGDYEEK